MGIPAGPWHVGDALQFSVNTHNVTTGAVADASSLPTFRVYSMGNDTPLETGTMSKLDDTNTTGFYNAMIILSSGTGYAVTGNYTILVTATVAGVTANQSYDFRLTPSLTDGTADILLHSMAMKGLTVDSTGTGDSAVTFYTDANLPTVNIQNVGTSGGVALNIAAEGAGGQAARIVSSAPDGSNALYVRASGTEAAVKVETTGTGMSAGIEINTSDGPGIGITSTNADGVKISGHGNGITVHGVVGSAIDLVAEGSASGVGIYSEGGDALYLETGATSGGHGIAINTQAVSADGINIEALGGNAVSLYSENGEGMNIAAGNGGNALGIYADGGNGVRIHSGGLAGASGVLIDSEGANAVDIKTTSGAGVAIQTYGGGTGIKIDTDPNNDGTGTGNGVQIKTNQADTVQIRAEGAATAIAVTSNGDAALTLTSYGSVPAVIISNTGGSPTAECAVKIEGNATGSSGMKIRGDIHDLDARETTTVLEGFEDPNYDGLNFYQIMRLIGAALLGKANGLSGTTVHFRDLGDTKNRITATVDSDGNRTAVTLDGD